MHNNLRQLRRNQDITQAQLAENIGTTRQAIIEIEKSCRNPSLALALKLAEYFNVDVREIFFINTVTQGLQKKSSN